MGLISKIRNHGLVYSFAIVFNRIVPQWLFRCRRFVIYQLDPSTVGSPGADQPNDVSVRWCESEEDFAALEALTYFRRSMSTGKSQGCIATIEGEPAGGFWANSGQFDESELGLRVVLQPTQAWLFAALVDARFRRRGVYRRILGFIVPALCEQGLICQLVAVNPNNVASNRVHQKHSAAQLGTVIAIRLFTTTFCWSTGDVELDRLIGWNALRHPIEIRVGSDDFESRQACNDSSSSQR